MTAVGGVNRYVCVLKPLWCQRADGPITPHHRDFEIVFILRCCRHWTLLCTDHRSVYSCCRGNAPSTGCPQTRRALNVVTSLFSRSRRLAWGKALLIGNKPFRRDHRTWDRQSDFTWCQRRFSKTSSSLISVRKTHSLLLFVRRFYVIVSGFNCKLSSSSAVWAKVLPGSEVPGSKPHCGLTKTSLCPLMYELSTHFFLFIFQMCQLFFN